MKSSRQTSTSVRQKPKDDRSSDPMLPHEADQTPDSQQEHEPRDIGKQAHRDVEEGLEDTDRRGGNDYQQRTQNEAHANRNTQKNHKRER